MEFIDVLGGLSDGLGNLSSYWAPEIKVILEEFSSLNSNSPSSTRNFPKFSSYIGPKYAIKFFIHQKVHRKSSMTLSFGIEGIATLKE